MGKVKIAIDFGFGETKVVHDGGKFKFPSWVGIDPQTSINELERISGYVVGEDARYSKKLISIATVDDLIQFFPVIRDYVLRKIGVSREDSIIITGLPPKYKEKKNLLLAYADRVYPQGFGITVDVVEEYGLQDEEVLILDIGYKTVDYILYVQGKKKLGDTYENAGVQLLLENVRKRLRPEFRDEEVSRIQKWVINRHIKYRGEFIDISNEVREAKLEYMEFLKNLLEREVGYLIEKVNYTVLAGGGAYYLRGLELSKNTIVPEEPEFSQARGYWRISL